MNITRIARDFIALPPEALPRVIALDDDDVGAAECWEAMRNLARGRPRATVIGRLFISADRPEWAAGRIL